MISLHGAASAGAAAAPSRGGRGRARSARAATARASSRSSARRRRGARRGCASMRAEADEPERSRATASATRARTASAARHDRRASRASRCGRTGRGRVVDGEAEGERDQAAERRRRSRAQRQRRARAVTTRDRLGRLRRRDRRSADERRRRRLAPALSRRRPGSSSSRRKAPAAAIGLASCEPVSDQEFERPVEADMGQRQRQPLGGALEVRRAEAHEAERQLGSRRPSASKDRFRIVRQVAGKERDLGVAVERRAVDRLAGERRADDRGQRSPPWVTVPSRVARTEASARTSTLAPANLARSTRARDQARQDRFQPVVVAVVEMIGLGRGEQDPVDPPRDEAGQPVGRGRAGTRRGCRRARLRDRRRRRRRRSAPASASTSTIWRSRRAKWSRKNGPDDDALIGLVAARHHARRASRRRDRHRRGSAARRSGPGEPSRSPGMRKRPGG